MDACVGTGGWVEVDVGALCLHTPLPPYLKCIAHKERPLWASGIIHKTNERQQTMRFATMEVLQHNHAMGSTTLVRMHGVLPKKEVH